MQGRGLCLPKGCSEFDIAVEVDLDQLAGFDLADHLGAYDVEGDAFAGKDGSVSDPPHDERSNAERIAAGNHSRGRHDDQGVCTLQQAQRIGQPVDRGRVTACRDKMDDDFRIGGRLKDRATLHQFCAQGAGVRDIAIMRDGKSAAGKIGIKRLHIPQARAAGRRIAHVASSHVSRQLGNRFGRGEVFRHMPEPAPRAKFRTVPRNDARGFLPAVLQCMKAKRGSSGCIGRVDCTENAALFAQLVAICVEEGMGAVHVASRAADRWRSQWPCCTVITRFVRPMVGTLFAPFIARIGLAA